MMHERPGVYSVYDTSAAVSGGRAARTVGVAAPAAPGGGGGPGTVSGYAAGVSVFGEDQSMSTLLRLLFTAGAGAVTAVRVADEGSLQDYQEAFAALEKKDVQIVVCDSAQTEVQQALRTAVESASAVRRERIAVVGGDGDSVEELIRRAKELNSERVVLVGPDALDSGGNRLPGVFAAAAAAAVIAASGDPAVPLNGAEIRGLCGLSEDYDDNQIDLLVRGGVTPLECVGGAVSPVRGITTRTVSGGGPDASWRELTTILVADDVIPAVRAALRSKFVRGKNNARGRAAIRSQVIVELERKLAAEIIDGYDGVTVCPSEEDPTVCLVEFGFSVAHGLNQVRLTVHIEI